METNKLREYINKIDTLDYDHYLLMTKKFGKRETNNFLKQVIKTIEENKNLTDEEREFYLDNFDGYINRNKYEKELDNAKEETNITTFEKEFSYKELGDNTDLIGMYMREIASIPMLTEDEEKKYGKDLKLKDDINIFTDKTIPEYKGQVLDIETVFSSIKTEEQMNEIINMLNEYTFEIRDNEMIEQKVIKYYLTEYKKLSNKIKKVPTNSELNKYFSNLNSNKLNVFTEFNYKKSIDYSELKEQVNMYLKYMTARNKFNKSNLRLVVSMAKNYTYTEVAFLDLIQDGNSGLMNAIDRFDVDLGNKFSTYATWWIRQSITRGIADRGRLVRMPVHAVEKYNSILRTTKRLSQEYGRDATLEEVAEELEMPLGTVEDMLLMGSRHKSLDQTVGEEADTTLGDFVASSENFADDIINSTSTEEIAKLLGHLKERERNVIILRYGLDGEQPKTLEEVGQMFGVTRERIRQIESKSLRKLRPISKDLKIYLKK